VKEYKEGDCCPVEDCIGVLEYPEVENCSCHINPPCNQCVSVKLTCGHCGWEVKE
jgi:hypothetical protein